MLNIGAPTLRTLTSLVFIAGLLRYSTASVLVGRVKFWNGGISNASTTSSLELTNIKRFSDKYSRIKRVLLAVGTRTETKTPQELWQCSKKSPITILAAPTPKILNA